MGISKEEAALLLRSSCGPTRMEIDMSERSISRKKKDITDLTRAVILEEGCLFELKAAHGAAIVLRDRLKNV